MQSHPTWVRGLKQPPLLLLLSFDVAPYVGAWIETQNLLLNAQIENVAPYVSAWIETHLDSATYNNL